MILIFSFVLLQTKIPLQAKETGFSKNRQDIEIWNKYVSVLTVNKNGKVYGFKVFAKSNNEKKEVTTIELINQDLWTAEEINSGESADKVWIEIKGINTSGTGNTPVFGKSSFVKISLKKSSPYPEIEFNLDIQSFNKDEWKKHWKTETPVYFLKSIYDNAKLLYHNGFLMPNPSVDPFPITKNRGNWAPNWSYGVAIAAHAVPAIGLWSNIEKKFVGYEFFHARATDKSGKYIATVYCAGTDDDKHQFFAFMYPYPRRWMDLRYPEGKETIGTHFTLIYNFSMDSLKDPNMFVLNHIKKEYKDLLPGSPKMNDIAWMPEIDSVTRQKEDASGHILLYKFLESEGWYGIKKGSILFNNANIIDIINYKYFAKDIKAIEQAKEEAEYMVSKATKTVIDGDECVYWKYPAQGGWNETMGGELASTYNNRHTWEAGSLLLELYKHEKIEKYLPYIDGLFNWTKHFLYVRGDVDDIPASMFTIVANSAGMFLLDYYHTFKNDKTRQVQVQQALELSKLVTYKCLAVYLSDPEETDILDPTFLVHPVYCWFWLGKVTWNEIECLLRTELLVYLHTGDPFLRYLLRGTLEKYWMGAINYEGTRYNESWEIFGETEHKDFRSADLDVNGQINVIRRYIQPPKGVIMRAVVGEKACMAFDYGIKDVDITDYHYLPENNFQFKLVNNINKKVNIMVTAPFKDLRNQKVFVNGKLLESNRYVFNDATDGEDVTIKDLDNNDIVTIGDVKNSSVINIEEFKLRTPVFEKSINIMGFDCINIEPYCNAKVNENWNEDSWAGLVPGKHFAEGVPFFITDVQLNNGKNVIIAKDNIVRIPIDSEVSAIFLFGQVTPEKKTDYYKGEVIGKYTIVYEDGEKEEVPIKIGIQALTGFLRRHWSIDMFAYQPKKNKKIKNIEFNGEPMVFALTIKKQMTVELKTELENIVKLNKTRRKEEVIKMNYAKGLIRNVLEDNILTCQSITKNKKIEIAIIPPTDRDIELGSKNIKSRIDQIKKITDLLGISLKILSVDEFYNPAVFNVDKFPVAIYVGGQGFIHTFKSPGDGEKILIDYMKNKGFLMSFSLTGSYPFICKLDWNGKLWEDKGPDFFDIYGTKLEMFISGAGRKMGDSEGLEQYPAGEQLFFEFNPYQKIFKCFLPRVPVEFNKPVDFLLWRPISEVGLPEEDIFVPVLVLRNQYGKPYGSGIAYIEHRCEKFNGAKLIYVWGSIFDTEYADGIISDALTYAVKMIK